MVFFFSPVKSILIKKGAFIALNEKRKVELARAVGIPVGQRSGGRLATMLKTTTKSLFSFYPRFIPFLRRHLFS